jgi:hypothetical protein
MTDDLLARSTRALREATAPEESAAPATTLARLERSLRDRPLGRATRPTALRRWLVVSLAATFLVFTAWASASGRLARWAGLTRHTDEERAVHTIDPAPTARVTPPASAAATTTAVAPAPIPATSTVAVPAETEGAVASGAPPPRTTAAKPSAPDPDALYREAHEAHFVRKDPAAALAAWDRYLGASGPNGRFVLEARYNRALTLVRLGRRAEARAALQPFADGEYGGYRRDEAARLLTTLD